MKKLSIDEAVHTLRESIQDVRNGLSDEDWRSGRLQSEFKTLFDEFGIVEQMYLPSKKLKSRIADYNKWIAGKIHEDPGKLMEEIAYLAFSCLVGYEDIHSYQSYAAQHDLVISGSSDNWFDLINYLHLPQSGRTFVIEAKNTASPIEDHQFSRLCGVIHTKYESTCHLGIFVASKSASGFQESRFLRDSRCTQILFYAKTKKSVVVITASEFEELLKPGGLPKLLEAKIRDVESAAYINDKFTDEWNPIPLPKHLKQYRIT